MKASYKMTVVALCGAMLLASGCGAKTETSASSAAVSASETVSSVVLEAASSEESAESAPESEAVSEAVSEGASAVSEAASVWTGHSAAVSKDANKFLLRDSGRHRLCLGLCLYGQ